MSVFKRRVWQCPQCARKAEAFAWDYDPAPVCEQHGPMHEDDVRVEVHGVIDDQLEGGPRRFETMGDDAPYIETKSQWRREMEKRGLVNVVKHDAHYYAQRRKWHDEELRDTGRNREF